MNVFVTGGNGFLGRYVIDKLASRHHKIVWRGSKSLDLLKDVDKIVEAFQDIDCVVHLAAEVGGIGANLRQPGRFCFANLQMGINVVEAARIAGVKKVVMAGTVCSYPCHATIPFDELDMWDGYPEATNAPYGIAKRAIMELLTAYREQYGMDYVVLVPTNLYGPGDNFDPATSHVIPAMIRKFCQTYPITELWGTGEATRQFLYVEDAAEAFAKAVVLGHGVFNLGAGTEVGMRTLSRLVAKECGYEGGVVWLTSKPDGQPRRMVSSRRAFEMLGWSPKVTLEEGLARTVKYFREDVLSG
jgi:GDP-L-fucose synthase